MARPKKYGETIHVRFPEVIIKRMDELAKENKMKRSDVVREIVNIIIFSTDAKVRETLKPPLELFQKSLLEEPEIKKLIDEFENKLKERIEKVNLEDYLSKKYGFKEEKPKPKE